MSVDPEILGVGADFLEHYGIKGMRWGVRRSEAQLARARERKEAKGNASDDAKRHSSARNRGQANVSNLTDKELQQVITRIERESRFATLNPTRAQRGRAKVNAILAVGGTANAVLAFSKSPAGQALKTAIENAVGNDLGRAVTSIGDLEVKR